MTIVLHTIRIMADRRIYAGYYRRYDGNLKGLSIRKMPRPTVWIVEAWIISSGSSLWPLPKR